MRVLLFNPPGPDDRAFIREGRCTQEAGAWAVLWPPVTLTTAAALLRADGHHVRVVDFPAAGLGKADLAQLLLAEPPDLAVWSTGTPTLSFDLGLGASVREAAPDAFTAVLGTHVSVRSEAALAHAGIDAVLRGEPEGVLRDLCRALERRRACASMQGRPSPVSGDDADSASRGENEPDAPPDALASVRGLSWRGGHGSDIRHNPEADPLPAEAIPAPAWDGLDLTPYRLPLKGRPFLIVAPVRGCPYVCSFCTAPLYYGSKLRRRPVEAVVAEIGDNVARFGIHEFFLWADTFTADRRYVRAFCEAVITHRLDITWTCNSRVDTVDRETFTLMKQAGLWMVSFGIESGSDRVLAACGKNTTAVQAATAVTTAHDLGIRTAGHFIFGLPGETEESLAETLALALALPLDVAQFYAAAPFPGTRLYDEAVRNGWLRSDAGTGSSFSQSAAVLELPDLPAARVDAFRREAYRRFYLRPRAIRRTLSMLEPRAAFQAVIGAQRFLRWI
ncbi:MAG: B12-binding domain-containing radical SAM protein [Syntrophales bacterium]|jgi:radical SAM superfamily enzyme YgiQ (UPF0313 family)|nr:B12-binding domain-containing radical SAM protein [Syntrophales bacterium]MDD4339455.1 radical SAM protein [Syntrophales bacterium]HOG07339.1 radical SAM protein [Syntrophales bacterium]HPB70368.1 radical SAM protein [Syntrophales bacterium]